MIFWDTSALLSLVVEEEPSVTARDLLQIDPAQVAWWGTAVECQSALTRRERDGTLPPDHLQPAKELLAALRGQWLEGIPTSDLRTEASEFVWRHQLRAGDAFQLAAALTWAEGRPKGRRFVAFDKRLAQAARLEGFELVTFV